MQPFTPIAEDSVKQNNTSTVRFSGKWNDKIQDKELKFFRFVVTVCAVNN